MGRVDNYDDARAERDFRVNPPTTAPGQGADDTDWASFLGDSASGDSGDSFIGTDSSKDVNTLLNSSIQGSTVDDQNTNRSGGDLQGFAEEAAVLAGKSLMEILKEFSRTFSNNTKTDWYVYFTKLGRLGIITTMVGLVMASISLFLKTGLHVEVIIAGVLTGGTGYAVAMFMTDEVKKLVKDKEEEVEEEPEEELEMDEEDLFNDFEDEESFEEDDDDMWGDIEDLDVGEEGVFVPTEPVDIDSAIASLGDMPVNMYTRQYLYETFMKVLPSYNPTFNVMTTLSDASEEFLELESLLRDTATQVGTKEEKLPDLIEVRKNLFIIQLRATRPSGLKEQEIADELANFYKRDENGRVTEGRENLYAVVDSVVGTLVINILLGSQVMVSLSDMYRKNQDFILDTKNKMPMVWGITEMGSVVKCDGGKVQSYIISGKPRSGKSWQGQSIISQFCMFNSPKEIEFYIMDMKGTDSDYARMATNMSHIRGFECTRDKIITKLRWLITVEADRRKTILEKYNMLNIADLKKKFPEVELPYLYIVIDEMQGLTKGFTKEQRQEFNALLDTIVSQLPNSGFRLILFPHRIVNDIISKNTYTLIASKATLRTNLSELQGALDVTRKEFPYSLPNEGDMGIRADNVAGGKVIYCHGSVITSDNMANVDFFKYLGEVWKRLVPDKKVVVEYEYIKRNSIRGYGRDDIPVDSDEEVKPARDVTQGVESYSYEASKNVPVNVGAEYLEDMEDELTEEEESFWKDL